MTRKRSWLRVALSLAMLLPSLGIVHAQSPDRGPDVSPTKEQHRTLQKNGSESYGSKPGTPTETESVEQTTELSNEHLTLSVTDTGLFTMWTADGRYLLYPAAGTGYLSVKVDDHVYTNYGGSLTVETPLTVVDSRTAYVEYTTPENVLIRQHFALNGEAVAFEVEAVNQSGAAQDVSVRYLFDTQVDDNDGSPLYAPSVGVKVYETDIPNPSFSTWRGYDIWPYPTLTSVGTLSTSPERMVFGWWPEAFAHDWAYTPDPNQRFYTPGYTTSPSSDSCVLIYFDMGTLSAGTTDSIVTYYGTGEPTGEADRERLLSTFDDLREAVKSSMEADLDAFSGLQARYLVTMRLNWRDYLEAAWAVVSTVVTPEPSDIGKLGKDAEVLTQVAEIVEVVDMGTDVGVGLANLLDDVPSSATEYEVKHDYIYPRFMNEVAIGEYTGVSDVLAAVDQDYEAYVQQIPDPLPEGYPLDETISFMETQIAALNASKNQEAWVASYHENMCTMGKLGVLQVQEEAMTECVENVELAEDVSFSATLAEIGIFAGAGALKIAGIVGAPVTAGGSTVVLVPTEAYLWGGAAAIAMVPSIIGGISTAAGLTAKGSLTKISYEAIAQLPNDLEMRRAVFQGTGDWLAQAGALSIEQRSAPAAPGQVDVESIQTPNVLLGEDQTAGEATGEVLVRNTGGSAVNVTLYGNITTELNGEIAVVGLMGADPVPIGAGAQKVVEFSYNVLRSSLLDRTGYDLQLLVVAADDGGVIDIQGPFNSHFFAGTDSQLSAYDEQDFETISQGTLGVGETLDDSVAFAQGTESGRLTLSFPEGSDQDLHLYDGYGRHVGMNYSTGLVENEIPGVDYSGPTASPERITVQDPTLATYDIQVVAQSTGSGQGYDLSKLETGMLPAILDSTPKVNWQSLRTGEGTIIDSFGVQITEGGGSQSVTDVQMTPTDFNSPQGTVLSASDISCQAPSGIQPGASVLGSCQVTISPDVPTGVYKGVVTMTGRDVGDNVVTTSTEATLTVAEEKGHRFYLPLALSAFGRATAGITNGDFESGASGWVEHSEQGWPIIVTTLPGSITPHSGNWAAWLGGDDDEVSYIAQQVTVPPGSPYLAYWHWIASEDYCGYDFGGVIVNGDTVVDVYDLCESENTGGWVRHAADLSAYAGQSVSVYIVVETDSSLNSNLIVDDVSFQASAASAQRGRAAVASAGNTQAKSVAALSRTAGGEDAAMLETSFR